MENSQRDKKFLFFSLSNQGYWILILAEIAVFNGILYVSTLMNWPRHEFMRFLSFIPMYQAGVAFGYQGGIIGSVLVSLLFMPVIQIDPLIKSDPYGLFHGIAMIGFINAFGIFVGGAIGNSRKTQEFVNGLSKATVNITREPDPESIMLSLAREALGIIEAEYAAFLMLGGVDEDATPMKLTAVSFRDSEPETSAAVSLNNPLVWSAMEKASLATNSVASDPRFQSVDENSPVRTALVVPVGSEDEIYGSLLLANKRSDELFSRKDLSVAGLLAGTAGAGIHNFKQEIERQEQKLREQRMKELFSRFVSSSVVDYVLENPELLKGRWQEVTVLVSDIRDFTPISEKLQPQSLVAQLNEYFTRMVDIIFEKSGTIDKFIGDCIIAYWGAPAPDPEHAVHAAEAAMKMAGALDELNAEWTRTGAPNFHTGIALHTCSVLMGNLGDDRKKVFTIMGEEVDNAMKIEALNKVFNARIIVSQRTFESIGAGLAMEKLPEHELNRFGGLYQIKMA